MAGIRLKHVERFTDRLGIVRYYFRKGHGKRVALSGDPGSREFMEDYARAASAQPLVRAPRTPPPGTIAELVELYLFSPDFKTGNDETQKKNRSIYERFAQEHGTGRLEAFSKERLDKIIAGKSATPAAANVLLKRIRTLVRYGMSIGKIQHDPTIGVKRYKSGSIHSWTDDEITRFEERWPIGTLERTAFELHLYTGQRRGDVCKMRWDQIKAGSLTGIVQEKTKTTLEIPLHPGLARSLKKAPRHSDWLIGTQAGGQRSKKGYGGLMADAIDAAGLPERCVLHGLRKAAARRLAEAGCTASEIASITGHLTLEEVARYTRAAEQKHLAHAAVGKLKTGLGRGRKPK